MPVENPVATNAKWDRSFFGHPRGLSTLFFTEMWERFSYYGTRAILILFMTATLAKGGLGFTTSRAGAIYGLYTSMVFLLSLPGGWLADRIIGQRSAVMYGGIIIALGNFALAIPSLPAFYTGLALIVLGTGLLKPNVSTMVGALYSEKDVRRDAGFSIFYMGINIGAMIAPLVCGYLGENINWHYGFIAAGVGMTGGVIQYALSGKFLGAAGLDTSGTSDDFRIFRRVAIGTIVVVLLITGVTLSGAVQFSAEKISDLFGFFLAAVCVVFFAWLLNAKGYTPLEKRRFWAILVLFIASAAFWAAYEQAGSTLNLFAERNTNLHAWDFPLWGLFRASYFQSFNSIMLIALAPAFAWLWVKLGTRDPSITLKFFGGLVFVAAGFAILIPVAGSKNASPWWLTVVYLLHTIGELMLSPVGLSAITKLAPMRIASLLMGVWFLSISVGDYLGGRAASLYESFPLPALFGIVAGFCAVIGLLLLFLLRPMKRLTGGIN
jgi:proton-dependent oligopeptide transporter, POT family